MTVSLLQFIELNRFLSEHDDTEDKGDSGSDLGFGQNAKSGPKRTKSIAKIQEEQDEFTRNHNNLQPTSRKYISRRTKNYDDQESVDSDAEDDGSKDTGEIVYRDTLGNVTTIKPNMRFAYYKDIFTNLLR